MISIPIPIQTSHVPYGPVFDFLFFQVYLLFFHFATSHFTKFLESFDDAPYWRGKQWEHVGVQLVRARCGYRLCLPQLQATNPNNDASL